MPVGISIDVGRGSRLGRAKRGPRASRTVHSLLGGRGCGSTAVVTGAGVVGVVGDIGGTSAVGDTGVVHGAVSGGGAVISGVAGVAVFRHDED